MLTGPTVTRYCQLGGHWSEVDLTNCTATSQESFLIVYFAFDLSIDVGSGEFTISPVDPVAAYSEELLLSEVCVLIPA